MNEDIKDLLFKEVPLKILLKIDQLDEAYSTNITHDIKGSYSYVLKLVEKFEENDLVYFEEKGRKKIIKLTKNGEKTIKIIKNMLKNKKITNNKSNKSNKLISKLNDIEDKINNIYNEELKNKETITKEKSSNIGKRLGPYRRELKKIKKESSQDLNDRIKEVENKIQNLMDEKKEKLK